MSQKVSGPTAPPSITSGVCPADLQALFAERELAMAGADKDNALRLISEIDNTQKNQNEIQGVIHALNYGKLDKPSTEAIPTPKIPVNQDDGDMTASDREKRIRDARSQLDREGSNALLAMKELEKFLTTYSCHVDQAESSAKFK